MACDWVLLIQAPLWLQPGPCHSVLTFYGSGILNKKPAQLSLSTLTPGVTELQVVYFYKNLELSTDGIDVSYVETGSTVWWKYWIWALLDSVDVFIVT